LRFSSQLIRTYLIAGSQRNPILIFQNQFKASQIHLMIAHDQDLPWRVNIEEV
jgi:hypothetical protein